MSTRGGPTRLFWSIATVIAAGLLVFVLFSGAGYKPAPEAIDERFVRNLVKCMKTDESMSNFSRDKYSYDEQMLDEFCRLALMMQIGHYQATGRMKGSYLEAIKIAHNYNQTDVDIYICGLDYRHCPKETRALNQLRTSLEMKEDQLWERRCSNYSTT